MDLTVDDAHCTVVVVVVVVVVGGLTCVLMCSIKRGGACTRIPRSIAQRRAARRIDAIYIGQTARFVLARARCKCVRYFCVSFCV